jgi:hypothetical protein
MCSCLRFFCYGILWVSIALSFSSSGRSQSVPDGDRSWIGKEAFWKESAVARHGDRIIDKERERLPFPAKVEKVERGWLWVGSAWIQSADCMDVEQALEYFSKKLEADPQSISIRLFRAKCLAAKQDWTEALKDYNEILEVDPRNTQALLERAAVLRKLNKHYKALRDENVASRWMGQSPNRSISNKQPSAAVQEITRSIQPVASSSQPGMAFRTQNERSSKKRWDALDKLAGLGAEAKVAVPTLAKLIDDPSEPILLKTRAVAVLEQLGMSAVAALPALERVTKSKETSLREAGESAYKKIAALRRIEEAFLSEDEERIRSVLPDAIVVGDGILPYLLDLYYVPSISDSMRERIIDALWQMRFRSDGKFASNPPQIFIQPPIDSLAEKGTSLNQMGLKEWELLATFGREADQLMLEQIPPQSTVTIVQKLARAMSECLVLSKSPGAKEYFLDRSLLLANALSKQKENIGLSGTEVFEDLIICYRHPNADEELRAQIFQCLRNYLASCPSRYPLTSRFIRQPENRAFPELKELLFANVQWKSRVPTQEGESSFLKIQEIIDYPGTACVFSQDARYVAVYSPRIVGTLFAGSLGGGSKPGKEIQVFELETGKPVVDCGISTHDPFFSSDGRLIAVQTEESLRVWDLVDAKLHRQIATQDLRAYRFLADNKSVLSFGRDYAFQLGPGTMRVLALSEESQQLAPSALVECYYLAVSPNGRLLAVSPKRLPSTVVVYRTDTWQEYTSFQIEPRPNWRPLEGIDFASYYAKFSTDSARLHLFQLHHAGTRFELAQYLEFDFENRRIENGVPFGELQAVDFSPTVEPETIAGRTALPFTLSPSILYQLFAPGIQFESDTSWNVWEIGGSQPVQRELNWNGFTNEEIAYLSSFKKQKDTQVHFLAPDIVAIESETQRVVVNLRSKCIDAELNEVVASGGNVTPIGHRYLLWQMMGTLKIRDLEQGRTHTSPMKGSMSRFVTSQTDDAFYIAGHSEAGNTIVWGVEK